MSLNLLLMMIVIFLWLNLSIVPRHPTRIAPKQRLILCVIHVSLAHAPLIAESLIDMVRII